MMPSLTLVCLSLTLHLASCAWVPGREMRLAMWRARWSGVRHYSRFPSDFIAANENLFEFVHKDAHLENWQQACIPLYEKVNRRNSTRRVNQQKQQQQHHDDDHDRKLKRDPDGEWGWKGMRVNGRDGLWERPWVDPSCDAYSLGLHGTCVFSRDGRPKEEPTREGREADYVTLRDPYCYFRGPLTARRGFTTAKGRSDSIHADDAEFHPTASEAPTKNNRSIIDPRLIHMMYRCPSTRPLALWVCHKCSSTSMGNWLLRMESESLIKRVAHIMDVVVATWPNRGEAATLAQAKGILEDFPGSITVEEMAHMGGKFMMYYKEIVEDMDKGKGNRTTTDVSLGMPRSYCPLCCAWGDGRLKIIVARNPYVRLMSYYKMKMNDEDWERPSKPPVFDEGWEDFRPWIYTLLSHRERTGRFTGHSAGQFTDGWQKHCIHRDPTCMNYSSRSTAADKERRCAVECENRRPIVTNKDVVHAMPVVDSLFAAGYETHVREGVFQVMHLESIEKDVKAIEERLCREYDDCEPLPEYPRVYPRPENIDMCQFNAKTRAFSNCTVTWEELWPPSLVDLVNLHYAEDFRLLGYKTTPFDVMPIRKDG